MADIPTRGSHFGTKPRTFETRPSLVLSSIEITHKLQIMQEELKKLAIKTQKRKKMILPNKSCYLTKEQLQCGILIVPSTVTEKIIYRIPDFAIFDANEFRDMDIYIRNDSNHTVELQTSSKTAIIDGSNSFEGPSGTHWYMSCTDDGYSLIRLL